MELSKRLQTIANMVSPGNRLVDIGTDHGYIPISLLQQGKIPFALAMDIGKGPLKIAEDHIEAYCFEDKAVCRLSNGFEAYQKDEADTAVIAGMGGDLIAKILEEGRQKLPKELILQPQSEWEKVRFFLAKNQYEIVEEHILVEDGKWYVAMKAIFGKSVKLSEIQAYYGPCLLEKKDMLLKEYLEKQLHTITKIWKKLEYSTTASAAQRIEELKVERKRVEGAIAYYETI